MSLGAWLLAGLLVAEAATGGTGHAGQGTPPAARDDAAAPAADAPVAVQTRLSPDPSHIGDVLTLEVIVAYPKGYTVSLPAGLDLSPLFVVDVSEKPAEPTGEGLRKVFVVRLQAFDVGELSTPPFPVTYVDDQGAVETVTVEPRTFSVERLTANEVDPKRRGEDPPVSLHYPNETAETAVYAALATLLAVLVALWIYQRWAARRRVPVAPPPVPPHEEALARLAELEASGLLDEGRFQAYYLALTEIARAYLERRFGIPALDRTTEEIRRALVRAGPRIAPIDPDAFVRFLQRADLVKFARMDAELDEARAAAAYVRDLVEKTRPDAQAAAEAKAKDAGAAPGGADEGGAAKGGADEGGAAKGGAA